MDFYRKFLKILVMFDKNFLNYLGIKTTLAKFSRLRKLSLSTPQKIPPAILSLVSCRKSLLIYNSKKIQKKLDNQKNRIKYNVVIFVMYNFSLFLWCALKPLLIYPLPLLPFR